MDVRVCGPKMAEVEKHKCNILVYGLIWHIKILNNYINLQIGFCKLEALIRAIATFDKYCLSFTVHSSK